MNPETFFKRWLPDLLCLLMCLLALMVALHATARLEAPPESDLYRDMGAAQSILDGQGSSDPVYLDETRWYNPLTTYVAAGVAKLSGKPLLHVYTHAGVYANLLCPLCFYLFVATVFGRWPALAAVFAYVFIYPYGCEVWHIATYSPWLWPLNFTQFIAYLCLAACWKSLTTNRLFWHLVCGILLGLTFLGHTAPALIIAASLATISVLGILKGQRRTHLVRLTVIGASSLLVSLPYLLPILLHYRFHVINTAPMQYIHLHPKHFLMELLTMKSLVAACTGILVLFRFRGLAITAALRRFILVLLAVTGLFLGYGLFALVLEPRLGITLPKILPTFHFHIYFTAWESALFGVGLFGAANYLFRRCPPESAKAKILLLAVLALLLTARLPGYINRHDLSYYVKASEKLRTEQKTLDLYQWLLCNLEPDEVVLADDRIGLFAVGAAGRKTVAMDPIFSNPYVDCQIRFDDRDAMFSALHNGDTAQFLRLAEKYRVHFIAVNRDSSGRRGDAKQCWLPDGFEHPLLKLVFQSGEMRLYQLAPALGAARN